MTDKISKSRVDGRVLLVGLMGAGKTSVGRELARRLGCQFLDNDELLLEATGLSLRALFDTRGVAELHKGEWQVFTELLHRPGPWVASAAASAIADPRVEQILRERPVNVVWLRARVDTLVARVGDSHDRPLLESDARATLTRMAKERTPAYERTSTATVDVDDRSPGDVADVIVLMLQRPGAARRRSAGDA